LTWKRFNYVLTIFLALAGGVLLSGVLEPLLFTWVEQRIGRAPTPHTALMLNWAGWGGFLASILLLGYMRLIYPRRQQIILSMKQVVQKLDGWLDDHLGHVIDFGRKVPELGPMNYCDWLIVIAIALFAFLCQMERLQGDYPNVILGSDLANITSMALAYDHPALFQGDFMFSDKDNFRIYFQLHVLLSRWLGSMLGNYSISLVVLLGPTIFTYLIGLYLLGRVVLKHRYWALVFVVVNAIPVSLVVESWGITKEPAPRTAIQALLPYLLVLAWKVRRQPRSWIWIAMFTGLLTYVHAVSSPVWMTAILFGMWSQMPSSWPLSRRFISTGFFVMVMLLMGSAFIYVYFDNHISGGVVDYPEMIQLYRIVIPPDILNISKSTLKIIKLLQAMWLLPIGVVGTLLLVIIRRGMRKEILLVLGWLAAVIAISVMIPMTERVVEAYLRLLPIETELVRGTRYFVPLLSLLGLWGMSELYNRIKIPLFGMLVAIIGLVLIHNVYQNRSVGDLNMSRVLTCMNNGQLICFQTSDLQEILTILKNDTKVGSPVFFSNSAYDTLPLAVRYIAQRPLVYSYKDRGAGYSDIGVLKEWYGSFSQLKAQESTIKWFREDPQGLIDFVNDLGGKYLVLEMPVSELEIGTLPARIFYKNTTYTILELIP